MSENYKIEIDQTFPIFIKQFYHKPRRFLVDRKVAKIKTRCCCVFKTNWRTVKCEFAKGFIGTFPKLPSSVIVSHVLSLNSMVQI